MILALIIRAIITGAVVWLVAALRSFHIPKCPFVLKITGRAV